VLKTRRESFIGWGVFVVREGAYICGTQREVIRFSCEMGRMRGSDEFNDVDIDENERFPPLTTDCY